VYELMKSNQIKSNSHQLRPTNTSAKKTWADVMKSGGINVQIVLGNGNVGLTTPMKMMGERRGGAARRLEEKGADRERGTLGRGKDGPEEIMSHPIMCDNGLGNMYNLRENMANSAGE
jgi:hypothetical protein